MIFLSLFLLVFFFFFLTIESGRTISSSSHFGGGGEPSTSSLSSSSWGKASMGGFLSFFFFRGGAVSQSLNYISQSIALHLFFRCFLLCNYHMYHIRIVASLQLGPKLFVILVPPPSLKSYIFFSKVGAFRMYCTQQIVRCYSALCWSKEKRKYLINLGSVWC